MIPSLYDWQILPNDTVSFHIVWPSLRPRAKHFIPFYRHGSTTSLLPIIPTSPGPSSSKQQANVSQSPPKTFKTLDVTSNYPSLNNAHPSSQPHFPLPGSSSLGKRPHSVLIVALVICPVKLGSYIQVRLASGAGDTQENLTSSHCPVPCRTVGIIFTKYKISTLSIRMRNFYHT